MCVTEQKWGEPLFVLPCKMPRVPLLQLFSLCSPRVTLEAISEIGSTPNSHSCQHQSQKICVEGYLADLVNPPSILSEQ